jgi:hypothetical protein
MLANAAAANGKSAIHQGLDIDYFIVMLKSVFLQKVPVSLASTAKMRIVTNHDIARTPAGDEYIFQKVQSAHLCQGFGKTEHCHFLDPKAEEFLPFDLRGTKHLWLRLLSQDKGRMIVVAYDHAM